MRPRSAFVHIDRPDVRFVRRAFLSTLGLPAGISEEILVSCKNFPLRIWVIDNSGSMATGDGHKLVRGSAGREGLVPCSRWGELGDAILWHATLAARLGAPTEFRLLNAPLAGGAGGYQVIQCGVGDPDAEIAQVEEMLRTDPIGRTPLCAQINQVMLARTSGRLSALGHLAAA